MPRKKAPAKRVYLASDKRRAALLEVAARVVVERGWPALSMISVAEAAGVSRQLVYQHFASVDELMADTMSQLFRERYEHLRGGIPMHGSDLASLMRMVEQQTFEVAPERVRALWQMITATYSGDAETHRMSVRLRHLLTNLWTPTLEKEFGLSREHARAIAWMLHMTFWGAHQLVQDGEISRKTANELFMKLVLPLQKGGKAAKA